MPVTGRKPTEGPTINHVPAVHDWIEVPAIPYRGTKPSLPKDAPAETRTWWRHVTSLPHCAIWDGGEWQFALDTARVHAAFINGDMPRAAELRLRERAMGTTADARRDLRIRYVDEAKDEPTKDTSPAVNFAAERKKRLTNAG